MHSEETAPRCIYRQTFGNLDGPIKSWLWLYLNTYSNLNIDTDVRYFCPKMNIPHRQEAECQHNLALKSHQHACNKKVCTSSFKRRRRPLLHTLSSQLATQNYLGCSLVILFWHFMSVLKRVCLRCYFAHSLRMA